MGRVPLVVVLLVLALAAPASAQGPFAPLNDLLALGQGSGQLPDRVPTMTRAEPPLVATPRAQCGPGSRPEPGIQGRVPKGSDPDGLWCNVQLVAHSGTSGGFKTLRYVDDAGHVCAFYDTALLFPTNATNFGGTSVGVKVLDMTDPAHPRETATLTQPPMLSPHESLTLNPKRGLLAAALGNPATYPGMTSIYDVHADCRNPVLQATGVYARYGHESGFAPDGRTLYVTGTAVQAITAIDVTDPKAPHVLWYGQELAHGMTISDDGNRAYVADPTEGQLLILDTSEIQARKPNPQAHEIARLTWKSASIPQNVIRFTEDGHPYLLEFDEYTAGTLGNGSPDDVGAGRIVDIADERQPRVVSNLRLQVDQHDDHAAAKGDPGTLSPAQGYAAHYCNIPTQTDPTLVACSFIASGLRVFDITDVLHPKEVAYYVAPSKGELENGYDGSNYAMSQPAFDVARQDVWYTDGASGFNVLHLTNGAWPAAPRRVCASRRAFTATLRARRRVRSATATLGGRRIAVRRAGRAVRVRVRLTGRARGAVRLVIRARLAGGRSATTVRVYHPCTRRRTG
jgi:hypothetical protein